MLDFRELVLKNRSYRRFNEKVEVPYETLVELIDTARNVASLANLQPVRFLPSWTKKRNRLIFSCLKWAGYLKDWDGPIEGERPASYIILLADTDISTTYACDVGIVAQTILLGAVEKGLGGCIVVAVNKKKLHEELEIPEQYEIAAVLAIGKPVEKVHLVPLESDMDVHYWRDSKQNHYVPKRVLGDVIMNSPYGQK